MAQPTLEFIVVGAGPAGIQWATLLEAAQRAYVVLEESASPGFFFTKYPRSRRLISHNRCNFYPEDSFDFRLRHDWHSILGAPMSFCEFHKSNDFYPNASEFVDYLQFSSSNLNIKYNFRVVHSNYAKDYVRVCSDQECMTSKHLVVATGLRPRPSYLALHYGNFPHPETSPDLYQGKRIGIVGGGNAAFEAADLFKYRAQSVHMFLRRAPSFASLIHYPGGVRLQQSAIIDRYMLKSLDSVEVITETMHKTGCFDSFDCSGGNIDFFIFCGGFSGAGPLVRMLNNETKERFPRVDEFYQIPGSNGRGWYAGALMHGEDYRHSAGGFVHGFRYLIRAQFRYLQARETKKWASDATTIGTLDEIKRHVVMRAQTSSGLYQMQNVLADAIVRLNQTHFIYYEEVVIKWFQHLRQFLTEVDGAASKSGCFLKFAYGEGLSQNRAWDFETALTEVYVNQDPPRFLHPIFVSEHTSQSHHCKEDVFARWRDEVLVKDVMNNFEKCVGGAHSPLENEPDDAPTWKAGMLWKPRGSSSSATPYHPRS